MTRTAYADTNVAVWRSQEQIRNLLSKLNVVGVRSTFFSGVGMLEFVRNTKGGTRLPYRIVVTPKVNKDTQNPVKELDRAERQVWRVVYWWLKAKVEALDFGLVEFEQEFLPYMMLQDRQGHESTVAQAFFESMAGRLAAGNDPFAGLRPALPEGDKATSGE